MILKTLLIACLLLGNYLFSQKYENPVTLFSFYNVTENNAILNSVENDANFTKLNITYQNKNYVGGWTRISQNSFLVDVKTNTKYYLKKVENITISPQKTNIDLNEKLTFTLYFEKIPKKCRQFHFIEEELSFDNFKILNISLDKKQLNYTPYILEAQRYLPDIILVYFTDGGTWPSYENVFKVLKEEAETNLKLKNFSISDKVFNKEQGLELMYYSFEYNGTIISLEKNITNDSNRLLYLDLGSDYKLERLFTCLNHILKIEKQDTGYYTFTDRLYDMIKITSNKTLTYMSVN